MVPNFSVPLKLGWPIKYLDEKKHDTQIPLYKHCGLVITFYYLHLWDLENYYFGTAFSIVGEKIENERQ